MYQLIYTSRISASMDRRAMKKIADQSATRNAALNVTGMLIYSRNVVLQVLEGDQDRVTALFDKVCRDTRHFEVVTLAEGPAMRREFPDKAMGFKCVDSKDKHNLVKALADDSPLMGNVNGGIPGGDRMFA